MFTYTPSSFAAIRRSFLQADGLPFADVLDEQLIQQFCDQEGIDFAPAEEDVYSPTVTLAAWLSQSLTGCSCVGAVVRVIAFRVALGLTPCSANTGAYCQARAKFTEPFLQRLTRQLSFASAVQTLDVFELLWLTSDCWEKQAAVVWKALQTHKVGNRPGRSEQRTGLEKAGRVRGGRG